MSTSKRARGAENNKENTNWTISYTPEKPVKKPRRVGRSLTNLEIAEARAKYAEQRAAADAAAAAQAKVAADEERARVSKDHQEKLGRVLTKIGEEGLTLSEFVTGIMESKDQQQSALASRVLGRHGCEMVDSMVRKRPDILQDWVHQSALPLYAAEGKSLASNFHPDTSQGLSNFLQNWSMDSIVERAERLAPRFWQVLQHIGQVGDPAKEKEDRRRDAGLVFGTVNGMTAQTINERSSELGQMTGFFLLASGATRTSLASERLDKLRNLAKTKAFMIVWDNLNIPFRVSEQRHDSKDTFENGTTASFIPLYGVNYGEIPLESIPIRDNRRPVFDFNTSDKLPSHEQTKDLEASWLYHIKDILFDFYPNLRAKFRSEIDPPPSILSIPVHKTEHYPLPAMKIDESSLDGTLDVIDSIIVKTLQLSEDDIRKHGVVLCGGDQLTISLIDKASASRRDDRSLLDNISRWIFGQLGLFHIKLAACRMLANEYWGKVNGRAPWSLWKINTLLCRKPITVGWKAKKVAPFRPTWELTMKFALPANILDGFRIHCPCDSLDDWVSRVEHLQDINEIALKVKADLVSRRRVYALRKKEDSDRDIPLENIILFNCDALTLREFAAAIKRGDVGSVVVVLSHWMVEFRGAGSMPKYADALFELLGRLKRMDPIMRNAFLMNWLVNTTGCPNAFKEVDLLQEHQNMWAKVIYNARGSNRSWDWLSMVSLSIYTLRDVIHNVQQAFKVPHNGNSHTSPDTQRDINTVRSYLEEKKLQTFWPTRPFNEDTTPARNLFAVGAAYSNTPRAYKNFSRDKRHVYNKGVPDIHLAPEETTSNGNDDNETDEFDDDSAANVTETFDITLDDLALDDEEYVAMVSFMEGARDMAREMSNVMD
ncbi:hypothetical protein BD410DRAFT_803611 [Rickenella mellea]|uniref:DUF6589 domain-containing protein n=1 Tax=Rickenella mellea TaxID=50990 RepID=A0A4Y7Q427_9AGAM|nr:hypothetical protein BD410DRAFT_803611 [Rickenella mellea]